MQEREKLARGAGGHCFIKDMSAFVEMFEERKDDREDELVLEVLNSVVKLNQRLLIDSDKDVDLLKNVYGEII